MSLTRCESHLYDLYCEELQHPHKLAKRKAHMRGLVYGFANSNFMFAYSVCYYYGAWLIINDPDSGLKTDTIWKVAIMVLNGGVMIGMSLTAMMDVNNAFTAAEKIFEVLDRKPRIDCNPGTGLRLNDISGAASIVSRLASSPIPPGATSRSSASSSWTSSRERRWLWWGSRAAASRPSSR